MHGIMTHIKMEKNKTDKCHSSRLQWKKPAVELIWIKIFLALNVSHSNTTTSWHSSSMWLPMSRLVFVFHLHESSKGLALAYWQRIFFCAGVIWANNWIIVWVLIVTVLANTGIMWSIMMVMMVMLVIICIPSPFPFRALAFAFVWLVWAITDTNWRGSRRIWRQGWWTRKAWWKLRMILRKALATTAIITTPWPTRMPRMPIHVEVVMMFNIADDLIWLHNHSISIGKVKVTNFAEITLTSNIATTRPSSHDLQALQWALQQLPTSRQTQSLKRLANQHSRRWMTQIIKESLKSKYIYISGALVHMFRKSSCTACYSLNSKVFKGKALFSVSKKQQEEEQQHKQE